MDKKGKNCFSNGLKRQTTHQAYLEGRRTVPVNIRYYPEKSEKKLLIDELTTLLRTFAMRGKSNQAR